MTASRHSVQRRLVAYVSLTMLFLVAFAVALTYRMSYQQVMVNAVTLEHDLVRTVQAQAEVAVFAANENIAKGIIEGLRTNLNIKGVKLTSLNPTEFAQSGGSFEVEDESSLTTYALMSPVDGLEKIGELTVIRNELLVQEQASMWALRQSAMFLGQIALTAVLIFLFSQHLIGKPLANLADNLATIKPGSGERVHVASADASNEIGSLAQSANVLLDATEVALAEVKSILDTAPIGICVLDAQLRHTAINARYLRITGYSEDELLGHTHRIFFDTRDAFEQFIERVLAALSSGKTFHEERQNIRNGSVIWTYIQLNAINPGNFSKGFVVAIEDISTRKMFEQELLESNQALQTTQIQLRRLLDNSGEGFLTFGPDLLIGPQYSQACETMLGRSPEGCSAADLFFHTDPVKADLFGAVIASALSESDPDTQKCMLSLLPTEITRADVILKAEYKALDNRQFMAVLRDITAKRRMEELLRLERQRQELIVMAVSERSSFFEAIGAFREFLELGLPRLLQSARAPQLLIKELYREIHTYKGLLSQFRFASAPKALHEIESQLANLIGPDETLTIQQLGRLVSSQALQTPFEADLAILSDALGDEFFLYGDSIVLPKKQARQLESLAQRLLRGEPVDTSVDEIRNLLHAIGTLSKVSFRNALMTFDGLVKQAAQRMNKEVAPIQVTGGANLWIDPNTYRPFLRALVHVFRNAVAHGLETREARWEAGKDETGRITCTVAEQDNTVHLCIADDGAGINLQALRQRAVDHCLYAPDEVAHIPDDTIAQLIFRDNISTQQDVSDLAGRGVGLAAVLSETKNIGGEVVVKTTAGQGTQFMFTLPLSY